MNVVVIGGSGRVGHRFITEIASHPHVRITVADRVPPRDPALAHVELDLGDPASLRRALTGADVVVNTAGPYDRWGTIVLDAAIEAGVDYVDVCDDPVPTLALLDRDAVARAAGIRAVVGLGVSPGLTNFLAVIAARELDQTDLLATFWGDSAEGMDEPTARSHAAGLAAAFRQGRAAYTHLVTQTSSIVPVWRDGGLVDERAWVTAYRVSTSNDETGVYRVIGHPEPVTVPHTAPARDCINIGTVNAGTDRLMLPFLARVAAGELTEDDALTAIADALDADPTALASERTGAPLRRMIGAAAVGTRAGSPDGIVVFPSCPVGGSMSLETARPAVVGVLDLADAPVGVHAPEAAFDAETYLAHYAAEYGDGGPGWIADWAGPTAVVEVAS